MNGRRYLKGVQEFGWSDHIDYSDYSDHVDYSDYSDYSDHQDHDDWSDHSDHVSLYNPMSQKEGLLSFPENQQEKRYITKSHASLDRVHLNHHSHPPKQGHPLSNVSMVLDIVTESCNLDCSYCHESAISKENYQRPKSYFETAEWLISKNKTKCLRWIFHGGEPLLMRYETFHEILKHLKNIAKKHKVAIRFSLQTNGTLLDAGWIDYLINNGISIGVSLDGPPYINNVWRSRGRLIEKQIKQYGRKGGKFGILCVLTRTNVHKINELVPYFQGLGASSMRFNPCREVGRAYTEIIASTHDLINAKRILLDKILEYGSREIDAELMSSAKRYVAHKECGYGRHGICSGRPCGAGRKLVAISPEGNIITCGRSLHLPDDIGNIVNPGERLNKKQWEVRVNKFLIPQQERQACKDCKALSICTGGCPSFLWRNPEIREDICYYWKGIFSMFEKEQHLLEKLFFKERDNPDIRAPLSVVRT